MQPDNFNNSATNVKLTVLKDSQEIAADHVMVEVRSYAGYDCFELFQNYPIQSLPFLMSILYKGFNVEGGMHSGVEYWLN